MATYMHSTGLGVRIARAVLENIVNQMYDDAHLHKQIIFLFRLFYNDGDDIVYLFTEMCRLFT